jgi:hypothetical protein
MKREKRSPPAILAYRAEKALKRAVIKAIGEHRRNGIPIAVWRDGKVIRIPADRIEVREPEVSYTPLRKRKK